MLFGRTLGKVHLHGKEQGSIVHVPTRIFGGFVFHDCRAGLIRVMVCICKCGV